MINLGQIFNKNKDPNHIFASRLKDIIGFTPKNVLIFKKAFTHKSKNIRDKDGSLINYERLEFLGDSILGGIVSAHLFFNYPNFHEGDLTKLRSKIVSRESLNKIGYSLKLYELIDSSYRIERPNDNIHGNLLESLIGAIYVDKGFEICKKFILNKIINYFINLETINSSIISYKGTLIEWAQKNKCKILFKTSKDNGLNPKINFSSILFLDNKQVAKAGEVSKKKAEEKVAKRAYNALKFKFNNE
ncbi:MAG: ribonuclease III domain-containing protein [Flavobacteriaceae bacterium]|nr:ribonuclease III domain-containing protein [Flavobacteriaceae bacterium]